MSYELHKVYDPTYNARFLAELQEDMKTIEDALNGILSKIGSHISAKPAHGADQISYEGTDVGTAIKALNNYVNTLVVEAGGDSNPEVIAARVTYAGKTFASLKERLDYYSQLVDNGQLFKLTTDKGLAKKLINTGDLNDITEAGIYYVKPGSDANNPTVLNMPDNHEGFLEVTKADYATGTLQKFIVYRYSSVQNTTNIYIRNFGVGQSTWTPWAATADKLTTEKAISSITTESININKNQLELKDATLPGDNYPIGITVQNVNDEANTGFPMRYGFAMTVKYSNGRLAQYFMGAGNTISYTGGWVRTYYSTTGWSQWNSLYGLNSWANVSVTNKQPLTQGYTQKVKFDRVINDSHTQFNTSTNRFTAKVRGMYMVGVGLYIERIKDYNNVELSIYRNGSRYKNVHQNRQDPYNRNSNEFNQGHYASGVTVPLEVGDYIEIFIFVGAGQDLTISDNSGWYNYFDIYRIGDIPMGVTF